MPRQTRPLPLVLLLALSLPGCDTPPAQAMDTAIDPAMEAAGAAAPAIATALDRDTAATPVAMTADGRYQPPADAMPGDPATRPFGFSARPAPAPLNQCGFEQLMVPDGTRVYAAGAYSGSKLPFQIDDSGHQATLMEVAVNQPQAPVILMLGAYEPTVWSIGWSRGTSLVAVFVSGHHRQVVTGLPAGVPLLVSSRDNHGSCGSNYVSEDKADRLNPMARRLFGQPVDMLYPARNGKVVVGDELAPGTALQTDRDAPAVDSFRLPDSQLAGPAALAHAVTQGVLRPATLADVQAWNQAMAARRARQDIPPVAGGAPPAQQGLPHNGYVVLKPFRFPAGLFGANSATFYVPRGVARPTGKGGHSTVYDFNTLDCSGTGCARD
ncbi:hypothetical protein OK348_04395 [Flavobacterium sp. MXW15]|uniref:Uncharacterized protein n=1 Tax=Xanthomonas chitinilytica TaxID=2989819 RepID=A0ABT3JZ95_9XANT|nr:hypothetical protein [Xanthomonas sp. H13-6]MCW4454030.1 hypothetical protein [Flavobacterium sp. MXW15]MCW4473802.1 hypothetical protein [Xanthomonas sp. H13-6]